MRYVDFPTGSSGFSPKISALGFGCSAVMGRVGRKDSLAALSAALNAGITFFDTARSYGYGESEALLGRFFKGRRQSVVICTKFGTVPMPRGSWKQRVKPLAQAGIRLFPGLRKHARRHAGGEIKSGQFSIEVLRDSLETSLRELQTDYVDMLLLHAATLDVLDKDDLLQAMERLVESGKIRMAGISGDHPVIAETFRRRPRVLKTAQFALNRTSIGFLRETSRPEAKEFFLVANHPFGGPAGIAPTIASIETISGLPTLPTALRTKLKERDPQLMPEIVLNVILQDTGVSAVVAAMMQNVNLRNNVRAVEQCRFTAEEIDLLRNEWQRQSSPVPVYASN